MVSYKTLSTRNHNCNLELFKRYQALYAGGETFRDNISEFLCQNETDTPKVYQTRCREASYRGYVGPIVDFFASQLFSAPYAIRPTGDSSSSNSLDDFYSEFKEDVDLAGTDLTAFLKNEFTEALVKGVSYWMLEMPSDNGEPATDLQSFKDRNLDRARLCDIAPECVLDWECNDYGDYEWVILHWKSCSRKSPVQGRDGIKETWKVLYPDHIEVYEIEYPKNNPPKEDTEIALTSSTGHSFGKVPLIKLCLPAGLWILNRAADAQIEHFRVSAALGWAQRRAAYAVGVFNLSSKDILPTVGPGYGIILGPDESFKFAEPSGTSFNVLQEEVKAQRDEIYRITNQMAASVDNTSGALGRSADSKSLDMAASEIILHAYSSVVKEAIEKTFELISDGRGEEELHFSIEGMNKFYLTDALELVETAIKAKSLSIPSETLYHELNYRVAEALLPWDTTQEVKDQMRKEIFSAKAEPLPVEEKKTTLNEIDDDSSILNNATSTSSNAEEVKED